MTELLDEAIMRLRERPEADQDEAAKALLAFLDRDRSDYRLTAEQVEEVRRTRDGLRDRTVKLLTVEETEEMWRRLEA